MNPISTFHDVSPKSIKSHLELLPNNPNSDLSGTAKTCIDHLNNQLKQVKVKQDSQDLMNTATQCLDQNDLEGFKAVYIDLNMQQKALSPYSQEKPSLFGLAFQQKLYSFCEYMMESSLPFVKNKEIHLILDYLKGSDALEVENHEFSQKLLKVPIQTETMTGPLLNWLAIHEYLQDIVTLVEKFQPELNTTDSFQGSPLFWTLSFMRSGHNREKREIAKDAASVLIDYGAETDEIHLHGNNLLMKCVESGNLAAVKHLLSEALVSETHKNHFGETALDVALKKVNDSTFTGPLLDEYIEICALLLMRAEDQTIVMLSEHSLQEPYPTRSPFLLLKELLYRMNRELSTTNDQKKIEEFKALASWLNSLIEHEDKESLLVDFLHQDSYTPMIPILLELCPNLKNDFVLETALTQYSQKNETEIVNKLLLAGARPVYTLPSLSAIDTLIEKIKIRIPENEPYMITSTYNNTLNLLYNALSPSEIVDLAQKYSKESNTFLAKKILQDLLNSCEHLRIVLNPERGGEYKKISQEILKLSQSIQWRFNA